MLFSVLTLNLYAEDGGKSLELDAVSAILIEGETGKVLYESNADQALPPASVTKVMTLLLVMEAVDSGRISLDDTVQASEYAASMGGSQIYLKAGETMSVNDMLKSVVVASANDAAMALAEFVCGSEESFVAAMNTRASELGMQNTHFENPTGLDDDAENHLTSARDIAIMSRELLKHKTILDYTGIWMDSIRDGAFGLTNTNRLIRFYNGANGLKTGSTSKAKFCISATAKRDNMQLIAVIMASPTRDIRNECAKKLLDYGFANYSYICYDKAQVESPVKVLGGISDSCAAEYDKFDVVLDKASGVNVEQNIQLPESISAPVKEGDEIGEVQYILNGEVIGTVPLRAAESVDRISYWGLLSRMIDKFLFN